MLNVHVPSFLFTHPCTLNCNDSVVPRITMRNDGRTASLSHSSSFGDTCSTLVFTPGTDRDDRTWRILRACQLRPSPIRSAAVSAASAARENRHATTADVWPFSSLVSRVALVQGKKLVSYTCHALQRDAKGCNGQSPEGLRCVEDGRLLGESPGI